jgi:hypothetical protein
VSADVFITTEMGFAGFLCYLFGDESLIRIELDDIRRATFHFHAPSLDCEEYLREYHAGQLAISDYREAIGHHTQVGRLLRDINRSGKTIWERDEFSVQPDSTPSRPDSFWANARQATELRRAEREQRERQEQRPQQRYKRR